MRGGRHTVTGGLLCLVAVCVYNVVADNTDVVAQAETAACGAPRCALTKTRELRHPFGQSFTFQTSVKHRSQPLESGGMVDVACHRSFYLVGPYSCARDTP